MRRNLELGDRRSLQGFVLLPLVLASAAVVAPGQTVVAPAFRFTMPEASRIPGYFVAAPTSQLPMRTQLGFDSRDLGLQSAVIRAIAFRKAPLPRWVNPAITLKLEVSVSHGPNRPQMFGRNFAANHGPDRQQVFTGAVSWPASPPIGAHVARIPFTAPFRFSSSVGSSLVVDVRTTANSGQRLWYYDQAHQDIGGALPVLNIERNCVRSVSLTQLTALIVGGHWHVAWRIPHRSVFGIGSLGAVGRGGKWGSLTLPVDLAPLGAPGCKWGVASEVFWGLQFDANGVATMPRLPIPNSPTLVGATFFEQTAAFVPSANALGMVTLPSFQFVIASGATPSGVTIWKNRDIARSPVGSVDRDQVPFVEFAY